MPIIPHSRPRRVIAGLTGLAALALGAASAAALPSNPPTDASAAKLTTITRTIATPQPTSNRGFNGYATVTVRAPAGRQVLQGFATISGGLTGSVVIRSTQTLADRFLVRLVFPGEQGKPGTLHVLVQTLPRS